MKERTYLKINPFARNFENNLHFIRPDVSKTWFEMKVGTRTTHACSEFYHVINIYVSTLKFVVFWMRNRKNIVMRLVKENINNYKYVI